MKSIFILLLTLLFFRLSFATLSGLVLDFGLTPNYGSNPNPDKKKHLLPNCDLFTNQDEFGLESDGYCLGPIGNTKPTKSKNSGALTILDEFIDEDGRVIVVKRDPFLMSLTTFLNLCDDISEDSLTCEYRMDF